MELKAAPGPTRSPYPKNPSWIYPRRQVACGVGQAGFLHAPAPPQVLGLILRLPGPQASPLPGRLAVEGYRVIAQEAVHSPSKAGRISRGW